MTRHPTIGRRLANNRQLGWFIAAICLPLPIGQAFGVQLAIGDLVLLAIGLPVALLARTTQRILFLRLIAVGAGVILLSAIETGSSLNEVLTAGMRLGFATRCAAGFFLGRLFAVRSDLASPVSQIIVQSAKAGSVLLLLTEISSQLDDSPLLIWSSYARFGLDERGWLLTANIFGIPLYAQFGVNTLAVSFLTICCLIVIALSEVRSQSLSQPWRFVLIAGFASGAHLLLAADSRQAIVGGIAFASVGFYKAIRRVRSETAVNLVIAYFALFSLLVIAAIFPSILPLGRVSDLISSVANLELDGTGRGSLVAIQLEHLLSHPFTGSGFNTRSDILSAAGAGVNSAHNQLLGVASNGGIVFAWLYISLVYRWCKPAVRGLTTTESLVGALTLVTLFVVGAVADPFTVAPIGGVVFALNGAVYARSAATKSTEAAAKARKSQFGFQNHRIGSEQPARTSN